MRPARTQQPPLWVIRVFADDAEYWILWNVDLDAIPHVRYAGHRDSVRTGRHGS